MAWKALAGSALALTAGAVTSSVSKSQGRSEAVSQRKKKSVVVIGAGLMGLGTALHLAERGHQVTIWSCTNSCWSPYRALAPYIPLWVPKQRFNTAPTITPPQTVFHLYWSPNSGG